MTQDEALDKTKKLLRTLVSESTEYNLAIYDADDHEFHELTRIKQYGRKIFL